MVVVAQPTSLIYFIVLTSDCPSSNPSSYMLLLDLRVKVQDNRIIHLFYKKEVSNPLLITKNSAMPCPKCGEQQNLRAWNVPASCQDKREKDEALARQFGLDRMFLRAREEPGLQAGAGGLLPHKVRGAVPHHLQGVLRHQHSG